MATFRGCEGLKNIQLSEYIREIEGYAFYGCESLENINIPRKEFKVIRGWYIF